MNTERAPKIGETWSNNRDTQFLCVVDTPDRMGRYVWDTNGIYSFWTTWGLTPPPIPLPEVFVNVDADDAVVAYTSREEADAQAWADRVAVLHLHPDGHTTIDRLDGRGEL